MFASDHTTPSEARPAPPRAAPPRIAARPVQPPLPPVPESTSSGARVDARTPARLRILPSWLLSHASAIGSRLVDDALAADGVRRQDYRVLVALDEAGAASQADLGRAVWLDRSDLHGVVTELEGQGFLERERDPADRRRNIVRLTPKGQATLQRLHARVDDAQDLLLTPLSAADRNELVRLLQALVPGSQPESDR